MTQAYMPQPKTIDWATPKATFDALWDEFGPFTLDPCGQKEVHYSAWRIVQHGGRCYDGSTEVLDGLLQPWNGNVWLNPPYGRRMPRWIEKANMEVTIGNVEIVVALIPSRTDTKMWQKYILREAQQRDAGDRVIGEASLVRFLPGRLKFGNAKSPAPFPSAVVVFRGRTSTPPTPPEASW